MRHQRFEGVVTFLVIGIFQKQPQISALGAVVRSIDRAGQRAVGCQRKGAAHLSAAGIRHQHRQFDHLAGNARAQQPVAALQIRAQVAHWRALVRWVEDEVTLAILSFHHGLQSLVFHTRWNLNGRNHVVAIHRRRQWIHYSAPVVHRHIDRVNPCHPEHRDQQRRFVFAVPVAVAIDVGSRMRLQPAYTADHDEVADVLLDVLSDPRQLCIEIRRTGDQLLRLSRNLRRGRGAVCLKLGIPRAERPPLCIDTRHRRIAPLHCNPRRERAPRRTRRNVAQDQCRHTRHLPAPMVRRRLHRLNRRVVVPGDGVRVARRQVDLQRLEDNRNSVLNLPYLLLRIGCHQLFAFADLYRSHVHGGQMHHAPLLRRKQNVVAGITHFDKVGVLRLIGLLICRNGPRTKIVDLFVLAEVHLACVVAALRLEDADCLAFPLHGAALVVDRLHILVVENHRVSVLGVVRRLGLGRFHAPVRHGQALVEPTGKARHAEASQHCRHGPSQSSICRHTQFPLDDGAGARVNTSCCWSAVATFW